jgi:hypothetical protein
LPVEEGLEVFSVLVMADQLEKLCGSISLTEGEKVGLTITEGEVDEVRAQGGRCLVGKVWMGRRANKEAFKTVLSRIWRIFHGVIFKELDDNVWLFEFEDVDDMRSVLGGRPWSFDRQMLVVKEFDGMTPASQIDFNYSPFWVQIHDMPLLCMTKGIGSKIGESMGRFLDIDLAGDGAGWGRCLRIRVEIDLSKPLERGRALNLKGNSHWVMFKYEKLPMLCFDCGRIIHGVKGCPVSRSSRLNSTTGVKEWGVWLRADDGRRRNFNGSPWSNDEGWKNSPSEERREGSADQGWRSSVPGQTNSCGGQRRSCSDIHGVTSGESAAVGTGCHGSRRLWAVGNGAIVGVQLMSTMIAREDVVSGGVGELSRCAGGGGAVFSHDCDVAGRAAVGEQSRCAGGGGAVSSSGDVECMKAVADLTFPDCEDVEERGIIRRAVTVGSVGVHVRAEGVDVVSTKAVDNIPACEEVEERGISRHVVYVEAVGGTVGELEAHVGDVSGRRDERGPSRSQLAVHSENVGMLEAHHAQLTHVTQSPNLRQWKRSARRGGVTVPHVATGSSKKRKGSINGGAGISKRRGQRGNYGSNMELAANQEMAEAEVQPRRPL